MGIREAYWIPDPKPHPDYETYVQMLLGSFSVGFMHRFAKLLPENLTEKTSCL